MKTIDQLLDYIEDVVATHPPDASECDCRICSIHNSVCHLYNRMMESQYNSWGKAD